MLKLFECKLSDGEYMWIAANDEKEAIKEVYSYVDDYKVIETKEIPKEQWIGYTLNDEANMFHGKVYDFFSVFPNDVAVVDYT